MIVIIISVYMYVYNFFALYAVCSNYLNVLKKNLMRVNNKVYNDERDASLYIICI